MSIRPQTFVKIRDYEELLPGTSSVKTFVPFLSSLTADSC